TTFVPLSQPLLADDKRFDLFKKVRRLPSCLKLELEAHRQLRLARIAHANAQEAVEVEQLRRRQWIHVVLVVEGVEHFELRNKFHAFAKLKWTVNTEVERKERVVFAEVVAPAINGRGPRRRNHEARR